MWQCLGCCGRPDADEFRVCVKELIEVSLQQQEFIWPQKKLFSETVCSNNQWKGEEYSDQNESDAKLPFRTNPQYSFDLAQETAIVLDFDDTIFPTSYLEDCLSIRFRLSNRQEFS